MDGYFFRNLSFTIMIDSRQSNIDSKMCYSIGIGIRAQQTAVRLCSILRISSCTPRRDCKRIPKSRQLSVECNIFPEIRQTSHMRFVSYCSTHTHARDNSTACRFPVFPYALSTRPSPAAEKAANNVDLDHFPMRANTTCECCT